LDGYKRALDGSYYRPPAVEVKFDKILARGAIGAGKEQDKCSVEQYTSGGITKRRQLGHTLWICLPGKRAHRKCRMRPTDPNDRNCRWWLPGR
jgi:hypothetical protein